MTTTSRITIAHHEAIQEIHTAVTELNNRLHAMSTELETTDDSRPLDSHVESQIDGAAAALFAASMLLENIEGAMDVYLEEQGQA